MTNILLVDDVDDNLIALEISIEEYMENNNIESYEIILAKSAVTALQIVDEKEIDIIFLDIMMPVMSGFEFLKILRKSKLAKRQPIVVMTTALGDEETKQKEKEHGANAYMVKPINAKVVSIMLDKFLNIEKFDIDDEFEFDLDEECKNFQVSEVEFIIRKSYDKLSASEFMDEYTYNIDNIEADLEDLNIMIFDIFETSDDTIDLNFQLENIINICHVYQEFLLKFMQLRDLYIIISSLTDILEGLPTNLTDQQEKNVSRFIKSIMFDLIEFKEQVFVEKTAQNIYYMNASIASSCIQIKYILSNK